MKKLNYVLAGIVATALLASGLALAESKAVSTMAKITMSMNHFPSDADKEALADILDSDEASDDEADIAMAISNLEHKLTPDDAERLTEIANDSGSDESVRKLARILLGFNHAAGDEHKATLAALAGN